MDGKNNSCHEGTEGLKTALYSICYTLPKANSLVYNNTLRTQSVTLFYYEVPTMEPDDGDKINILPPGSRQNFTNK